MNRTERSTLIDGYRTGTADVEAALAGITEEELDRPPTDPTDWTARQVAHHLADSERWPTSACAGSSPRMTR